MTERCPDCMTYLDKGTCRPCQRNGKPDTIHTPFGPFRVRVTRPGYAELWRPDNAPIKVNNTLYVVRGEFSAEPAYWYWDRRPYREGGSVKVEIPKPYASGSGGNFGRYHADQSYPGWGNVTESARHKIGEAIGPALLDYLRRPEVRADAIDAVRAAAARKWSDRADELRRRIEEAQTMIAELDAGAARIRAGGDLAEPPNRLTYRSSW